MAAQESVLMMRPADVARELGVSKGRAYALIRAGEVPSACIGGAIRIPRAAWESWLRQRADVALRSLKPFETKTRSVAQ
jgi:excisionase family DNA binding protein